MFKQWKINFFYLFNLITDDTLTFLSGIFVATSINILTSQIPESVLSIGRTYLCIACMMLFSAFLLIRWAIYIKPIIAHYAGSSVARSTLGSKDTWYNILIEYGAFCKLLSYLLSVLVLTFTSYLLLIFPNALFFLNRQFVR